MPGALIGAHRPEFAGASAYHHARRTQGEMAFNHILQFEFVEFQ